MMLASGRSHAGMTSGHAEGRWLAEESVHARRGLFPAFRCRPSTRSLARSRRPSSLRDEPYHRRST
jgi:hypothetical protein